MNSIKKLNNKKYQPAGGCSFVSVFMMGIFAASVIFVSLAVKWVSTFF